MPRLLRFSRALGPAASSGLWWFSVSAATVSLVLSAWAQLVELRRWVSSESGS